MTTTITITIVIFSLLLIYILYYLVSKQVRTKDTSSVKETFLQPYFNADPEEIIPNYQHIDYDTFNPPYKEDYYMNFMENINNKRKLKSAIPAENLSEIQGQKCILGTPKSQKDKEELIKKEILKEAFDELYPPKLELNSLGTYDNSNAYKINMKGKKIDIVSLKDKLQNIDFDIKESKDKICTSKAADLAEFTNPMFYITESINFPARWQFSPYKKVSLPKNVNGRIWQNMHDCCNQ